MIAIVVVDDSYNGSCMLLCLLLEDFFLYLQ